MEKKNNNSKFIKIGNNISFKRNTDGLDYDLQPGSVYTVNYDRFSESFTLSEAPNLKLPEKMYSSKSDDKFINKVLNRFNKSKNEVTGVMLSGLKGSGKTVMCKKIALDSNIPIILIDKSLYPSVLCTLFNLLEDIDVCVIIDEVDKLGKDYDNSYLLKILDGINSSGKKLMLFTCNDNNLVSEFLIDRCSRIRYWREFDEMNKEVIKYMLEDRLDNKDEVISMMDFIINNFGCISFDNVNSFIEEVNENPKDTFEELFNDMNLSSKK